jgi:hypothetical protein
MALLTHLHEWQPKQQISIDIKSQISITAALQEAESRVIQGRILQGEAVALDAPQAASLAYTPETSYAPAE